jgi:immunity protein 21 of polymorphic toxin system
MSRTVRARSSARGKQTPAWIGSDSAHTGPIVLGPRDLAAWRRARAATRRSLARFWAAADLERKPATVVDAGGDALVLPGWFRTAWHARPWGGHLVRLVSSVIPPDPARTKRLLAVSPDVAPAALWSVTSMRLDVDGPLYLAEVMVKHPEGTTSSARAIPVALPAGRYHVDVIPSWQESGATYQSLRLRRDGEPASEPAKTGARRRTARQPAVAAVTPEIRRAARKLRFIETTGGPLLLVQREAAAQWHGIFDDAGEPIYEVSPCDYDRAIAYERDDPFLLDVGTTRALVLPGSLPTAWHPSRHGGLLIRWAGADGSVPLLAGVLALPASTWRRTRLRLTVGRSGQLLLFDASMDGARPGRGRADLAKVPLSPGTWAVDVGGASGRSVDRGVESSWSVGLVRLRRP